MNKGIKKMTAFGLSSLLAASISLPSSSIASEYNSSQTVSAAAQEVHKQLSEKKDKLPISEDTFIIKYNKALTSSEHKAAGGTLIRQSAKLQYAEIKVSNKKNLGKVMKAYQRLGKVESVRPSFLGEFTSLIDPKASEQYQLDLLNIAQAHKLAGKNKVTVAVIDTGVDTNHPDLKNVLLPGYNAANPANQPIADAHGTHVTGIIAAEKGNGIGGHGIASNVKILPIDVGDGTGDVVSEFSVAEGILYAVDNGAKVINMSLRWPYHTPVIEEAVKIAIEKGVVVVAAAGNDFSDHANFPASFEGVISVGAVNSKSELAYFSSYGPSVDLVAPGEEVYSTVYDYEKKSSFVKFSGTSMASPVVAGVAALLLSKYPNLTPAQVEYVLEKTATDLGKSGFDTTYANGLVDPVKALSFDVKSIPASVKEIWTPDKAYQAAQEIDATERYENKDFITKPYEQKWVKFNVAKEEKIQAVLEGAEQYDYKLTVHFYKDGKFVETFDINQTQDGTVEGKLFTAPDDGTFVIGVSDVNGNYDNTSKKSSSYKLSLEKAQQFPEDESSIDKMINIDGLPYQSPAGLTLAGEETDYDYYTLKVDEDQLVKINMSGIPGLNTQISVFDSSSLFPEGEEISADMKDELIREMLEESGSYNANNAGISKSETLTFPAKANQEYIIKISGDAIDYDFGYSQLLALLLGYDLSELDEGQNYSSLVPYQLSVSGKVLPEDEDGLNAEILAIEEDYGYEEIFYFLSSDESEETDETEEIEETKSYDEQMNERIQTILGSALPHTFGQTSKGYIQDQMDIDYFLLEPTEAAVYQFNVKNNEGNTPLVQIEEVYEYEDENGDIHYSTWSIAENMDWTSWDPITTDTVYASLEKDKKYLVKVESNYYTSDSSLSTEPYQITSKLIAENPQDAYEPNTYENVKDLPGTKFQGNFATANDTDVFYYYSQKEEIKAISIENGKATSAMKNYPKEVISDFTGYAVIIEDSNGNLQLDEHDNAITYIYKGPTGFSSGSFKAKKGQGYFIEIAGWMHNSSSFSLLPYTFQMQAMNRADEVSSQAKPISLKKQGKNGTLQATGYLNAGITGGDTDWYGFTLNKDSSGIIRLEAGKEADGVIEIYQNGKLIRKADLHGIGENEEFRINLKKGAYQVKISDANGVASITPYTIKVNMK